MKPLVWTLGAALCLAAPGTVAYADAPSAEAPISQCISVAFIDHTRVLDDSTILFYMRGGKILKNALVDKCVGLRIATRGFTYSAGTIDQVCGNLQTIRVNDTGQICMLGPFTPYTPPSPQQR